MSMARRSGEIRATRRRSTFLFVLLGALFVAVVAGFLLGRTWIEAYLRSDKFRRFVSEKTGETLQAEGEFAPFTVSGTSFYCDDFTARGMPQAFFSALRIDQMRAEVSARRFFEHVWEIEQVTAQRVEIKTSGPRVEVPPERSTLRADRAARQRTPWLPNRVEIGRAEIRDANIAWGDIAENAGSVRGIALTIEPRNGGWDFSGRGGRLEHASFPPLEVDSLEIHYRHPMLVVQSAELRQGTSGLVDVKGEARLGDALALIAKLNGISVTPLLPEDWRLRLHGNLGGEVTIRSGLPGRGAPDLSGSLTLAQAQLEALPVLEQIALFTKTQQFRRLALNKVSADFRQEKGKLEVRNFVAESQALIRIEGGFTVVNGMIDGTFQVGVVPTSLQWLPGSQERVFTQQRAGYLWTPMRLSGPLSKPGEDLSPRLIAAAQGAIIQGVENSVRDTIQTGKDAAKGALDFLMPLFK